MLARLYAHEFPQTHLTAVAPGIIDTAMMDYLCDDSDPEAFPAVQRLRAAGDSAVSLFRTRTPQSPMATSRTV